MAFVIHNLPTKIALLRRLLRVITVRENLGLQRSTNTPLSDCAGGQAPWPESAPEILSHRAVKRRQHGCIRVGRGREG